MEHAIVAGAVHIVQHLLEPLLRHFRGPHEGNTHIALRLRAAVRRIGAINCHALAAGLPVVPRTGYTLKADAQPILLIPVEIPLSPGISHGESVGISADIRSQVRLNKE
jgi:hypothetical protein